jgi:hypothetical protein
VSVFIFVQSHVSPPQTVIAGQVGIEINVCLLFSGKLRYSHCDVMYQFKKQRVWVFLAKLFNIC